MGDSYNLCPTIKQFSEKTRPTQASSEKMMTMATIFETVPYYPIQYRGAWIHAQPSNRSFISGVRVQFRVTKFDIAEDR